MLWEITFTRTGYDESGQTSSCECMEAEAECAEDAIEKAVRKLDERIAARGLITEADLGQISVFTDCSPGRLIALYTDFKAVSI